MVTILTPKSVYVNNTDSSTYTLTWTNDSYTGQYAFEILYKIKSDSTWLTTGKISSTVASYDLRNLHDLLGIDLDEIQYRLVVYYKTTDEIETKDFSDAAYIYSLIFNSGSDEVLKIYDGNSTSEYPLFSEIKNSNIQHVDIQTTNGKKQLPLVDSNSPIAGNAKIAIANGSDGVKHFANSSPKFTYDTSKLTTYGTAQSYLNEPTYEMSSYEYSVYNSYYTQKYDGRYYNTAYNSYYTSYYGNKYYTSYRNNVDTSSYYGNTAYYTTKSGYYTYYTYSSYLYQSGYYHYRYYGAVGYGVTGQYYLGEAGIGRYGYTAYYYGIGYGNRPSYLYAYAITRTYYYSYASEKLRLESYYRYGYYMSNYGPSSYRYKAYYNSYYYYSYLNSDPKAFYATTYTSTKYYYATYKYYYYTTYTLCYYRTDSQYYYVYYTTTSYNYVSPYYYLTYYTGYYYYQTGYNNQSYSYTYTVT